MLLGVFGLPGGAEWLVILVVIVLLFVPSLALFWFGYVLGRKSAVQPRAAVPVAPTAPDVSSAAIAASDDAPEQNGDSDG
jgi:hypothetical protein